MARKGIPAWLDEETARRLDALKVIPRESRRDVVSRLLDEHDARAPSPPAVAPERKSRIGAFFASRSKPETSPRDSSATDETARSAALAEVPS